MPGKMINSKENKRWDRMNKEKFNEIMESRWGALIMLVLFVIMYILLLLSEKVLFRK